MAAIRRIFFDWSAPALPAAANWLLAHAHAAGDLSDVVVVVPGGRAGRRLLEILVAQAAGQDIGLSPPRIVTMGALPELLYPPQRPFADDLTQRLAWVDALRRIAADPATREQLQKFIPALPAQDETSRLLELADTLRAQHLELAADGLDFQSVADQTAQSNQTTESRRWQALRKVQRAYLDVLDQLQLWDKQTARLIAIERNECATDKRIILLGTVDMNRAARHMLDQISEAVTAMVFAPEELAERFDAHGCVAPDKWAETPIAIDDSRITVADDAIDQADEVARAIASWDEPAGGPQFRGDQITIGVCDERVVPQITRQLEQCGLVARWGPGRSITQTTPIRLLEALADYLERGRWPDFAALVRHVDLEAWLNAQGDVQKLDNAHWLSALDEYQSEHVQTRLGKKWLTGQSDHKSVRVIHETLTHALQELRGAPCPLTDWPACVLRYLLTVYGEREFDHEQEADRVTLAALETIQDALLAQQRVRATTIPEVTAAEAIRWALDAVAGETIAPPADPNAIELLGWLELVLDDAPALVVTTLNEGLVPKSSTGDMFLPDSLRTQLGLDDNARRYARDAYALGALTASRDLRIIVGRCDPDNNPLAPSRLLFACDDDTLLRRVEEFFHPPQALAAKRPLAGALAPSRDDSGFRVPPPEPLGEPLESLRVTQFRDYIACPYRFYLKHIVRVQAVDDAADELDGGAFGGLAHDVLNLFGLDQRRHSTSSDEIGELLEGFLQELVRKRFGTQPRSAVEVQIEQLRRRLQVFAELQAARNEQGWRILHTEVPREMTDCHLLVDGAPFGLRGRIDRIDVHEDEKRFAIWDYKTSDTARRPAQTHRKKDEWVDLQLPLYRHLAATIDGDIASLLEVDGKIQLGYIQLPKSVDGVKFEAAEWSLAELESADQRAHEVIRDIRAAKFSPPATPPPDYSEDLAGICLDGVFGATAMTR